MEKGQLREMGEKAILELERALELETDNTENGMINH